MHTRDVMGDNWLGDAIWRVLWKHATPIMKMLLSFKQDNATMHITLWVVGEDEKVHAGGAGSWTEDGDSLWVSSKVANVFFQPAQRLDLV